MGGLLYLTVDGDIYIPCYDANGNVTRYLDATGNTVSTYTYDAFGETIAQSGSMSNVFSLRYSTKYFDWKCCLYYYGYRYYKPQIMRWLTEDPIAENGDLNLLAFCRNNSISYLDLRGGSGKTLAEIEKTYRDMVAEDRKKGKNVAADNLEYFLSNRGGMRTLDWNWLRADSSVVAGEQLNRKRFEAKLKDKARTLSKGEKIHFHDYFDATKTASVFSELYYASGTFTVTSYGDFILERNGCVISIKGQVDHYWWDKYDWHIGLSAYVPGFGNVADADAQRLEDNGLAQSFRMESEWTQPMRGSYRIRKFLWNTSSFEWDEPRAGNTGIRRKNGNTTSSTTGTGTKGGAR